MVVSIDSLPDLSAPSQAHPEPSQKHEVAGLKQQEARLTLMSSASGVELCLEIFERTKVTVNSLSQSSARLEFGIIRAIRSQILPEQSVVLSSPVFDNCLEDL